MFGLNEIHPAVQKFEYLLTKADAAVAIIYGGKIVVAVCICTVQVVFTDC